jgi:hypothetical protein
VADGINFNFLDISELDQCLKKLKEHDFEILDFFVVVRYHYIMDNGKRVPLRFDYYVIRFEFQRGNLELQIRHEKGTQRILSDDLTNFFVKQINFELLKKQLIPLFREFGKIIV